VLDPDAGRRSRDQGDGHRQVQGGGSRPDGLVDRTAFDLEVEVEKNLSFEVSMS
jgi:hypothetical protein